MTFERMIVHRIEAALRASLSDTLFEVATHPGAKIYSYDYELDLSGVTARSARVRFLPSLNSEYGKNRKHYSMLPVEIGVEVFVNGPDDALETVRLSERSKVALRRAFFDGVSLTALFQTVSEHDEYHSIRQFSYVMLALARNLTTLVKLRHPGFDRALQPAATSVRWDDALMSYADAFATATMHLGLTREQWIVKLADLFSLQRPASFIGDRSLEDWMAGGFAPCLILRPPSHEEISPWDALPSSRRRTPVQEPAAPTRASRGVLGPIRRRIDL